MATLLGIETSGSTCSVALFQNQQVSALIETEISMLHAEKLTQFIELAFQASNLQLSDLEGVVVSSGPGSYTGLRIGTSVAKGICLGLSIPLLSISTLASWIEYAKTVFPKPHTYYLSVLQARNGEYWIRLEDSLETVVINDCLVTTSELNQILQNTESLIVCGSLRFNSEIKFQSQTIWLPAKNSAIYLKRLAYQKFHLQKFENLISFEPSYLKEVYITSPKQ
ncbi:MAG: tRNA (adenosine(37)-N6)-threonylcarbamoyltransferase complex dimerization subunit type 1 TsaB [Bacteroidia bacterium]|nr:tRNA (adenosine(37)-N6)-threonylcarbamoyltransferase complex dimerization subunit type 1 TsaB [Bacteroidia bacterium]